MAQKADSKSLLGLFLLVILAILALAFLLISMGELPWLRKTADYKLFVPNARGLVKGAEVRMAGVKVGMVASVAPVKDRAELVLQIDSDIALYEQTRASLVARSLLGEKLVDLTQPAEPGAVLPPGSTLIISDDIYDINEMFLLSGRLLSSLNKGDTLVKLMGVFDKLDAEKLDRLAGGMVAFADKLGKLDINRLVSRFDAMASAMTGLRQELTEAKTEILPELKIALTETNKLLKDLQGNDREQVRSLLQRMNRLLEGLDGTEDRALLSTLSEVRTLSAQLKTRLATFDALAASLKNLADKTDKVLTENDLKQLKKELFDLLTKQGVKVQMF